VSDSPPQTEDTPFHLTGNFAPIFEERTEFDLDVSGAIPPELTGRFFRNGSNPSTGWSPHWFFGNGMIHGVELKGSKALWYRNRYVKTPLLENSEATRMRPDGTIDRTYSYANTHVIHHAGRILALEEGAFPYELDREVGTIGPHDFEGKLLGAMTAHPRICPETGELLFFGNARFDDVHLYYYRADASGRLVQAEPIHVKAPTMMHDWNVTRNHVVFMDLPMLFDPEAIGKGGIPISWDESHGARLGVMPRAGTSDDIVWCEIEPCYVFHALNGYEEDGKIILDVCRIERISVVGAADNTPPILTRWTIDPDTATVTSDPLDDRGSDFPRVADAVVGLKHRYGYLAGGFGGDGLGSILYKHDLERGSRIENPLGAGEVAGEPVFAPLPGSDEEDAGWILTYTYDPTRDASDLIILDAQDFGGDPVARIHLPGRVPFGFHGSWIPDES
jgi:carotenoid cleavage dioxygenase-like enzyme